MLVLHAELTILQFVYCIRYYYGQCNSTIKHIERKSILTIFYSLQIYPFEREAVQVYGMWQGFLSVKNVGSAQNPAHGRVAPQVSGVQQEFQSAIESQDPSFDSHRHQTLQLLFLRQSVQEKLRPKATQPNAQPRRHILREYLTQWIERQKSDTKSELPNRQSRHRRRKLTGPVK